MHCMYVNLITNTFCQHTIQITSRRRQKIRFQKTLHLMVEIIILMGDLKYRKSNWKVIKSGEIKINQYKVRKKKL